MPHSGDIKADVHNEVMNAMEHTVRDPAQYELMCNFTAQIVEMSVDKVWNYIAMLHAVLAFTWSAIVFGLVVGLIGGWW